jgi:hypothetical protein
MRDVKDLIGAVMRALDGAEISEHGVVSLEFKADGELLAALNEAYIELLEFVHDHERRMNDSHLDYQARAALRRVLKEIVRLSESKSWDTGDERKTQDEFSRAAPGDRIACCRSVQSNRRTSSPARRAGES